MTFGRNLSIRIGIVTPAFDVAPYIGDAIRSVLAQTHRTWTMTIVDDGSADQTAALAAAFDDPRIRLIRQRNAGVSAARNRGLAATNAEAVLFLDADDWLSPDALSVLAATLRASPAAIAAVGPYQRAPNGKPVWPRRVSRPMSGDLLEALLVRNLFANGGHLLIRRHMLEAAGPFDASLSYGEDWEYWIRLAQLGPFAGVRPGAPLLFVRERHDSAYHNMAAQPEAFVPCMNAIFNAPELKSRMGAANLARLRRRAEAENNWVIGRELIRHGKIGEGRHFLRRAVVAAPSIRRLALFTLVSLPMLRIGPFRSYPMSDTD
jgi:glycosyltransferase involved in cell wall biosynthesis